MKCNTNANIQIDAQLGHPGTTVEDLQASSLTAQQVIDHLKNPLTVVMDDNFEEVQEEKEQRAKALERIPDFKDYGLIVTTKDPAIGEASSRFYDNMIYNSKGTIKTMNKLNANGKIAGSLNANLYSQRGTVQSDVEVSVLNKMAKAYLGKRVPTKSKYFTGTKDNVKISPAFQHDYNKYIYSRYLNEIGHLATITTLDKEKSQEYKDTLSYMKSVPLTSHITQRISDINRDITKIEKGKDVKYDLLEITRLREERNNLKEELKDKKASLEFDGENGVKEYYDEGLSKLESDIADVNWNPTPGVLTSNLNFLDMITNSAARGKSKNILLEGDEFEDKEILKALDEFEIRAKNIREDILDKALDVIKPEMFKTVPVTRNMTDDQITTVAGLETNLKRQISKVLGMHQIDSPIVKWIYEMVQIALTKAFRSADIVSKRIAKLHKAQAHLVDNEDYLQRNADGNPNGYLTHKFSSKWFEGYGSMMKSNYVRSNQTLVFNPYLLFETLTKPSEIAVRNAMEAELKETLGEDYEAYREEALTKWNIYGQQKKLVIENTKSLGLSKSDQERVVDRWDFENSPLIRIDKQNASRKAFPGFERNPTSEKFLVRVPRRTNRAKTVDFGYYDTKYETIQSHPESKKFYDAVEAEFKRNQETLQNYTGKHKRVPLAYIGQSVAEHLSTGDYLEAAKLRATEIRMRLSLKENVQQRKQPTNSSTGKPELSLNEEIHSIPVEVNRRTNRLLDEDERYVELRMLDQSNKQVKKEMKQIKDAYKKDVYAEVDQERSRDLLQSVVMSVYSTHSFIEKSAIESIMNLGKALLLSDKVSVKGGKNLGSEETESIDKARIILEAHVTHFINQAFYDGRDLDPATPIFGDIEDDDTKRVTSRSLSKAAQSFGRLVVLGFSPIHAFLNVGQQAFSNLMKASERNGPFGLKELYGAYKVAGSKKWRNIIESLFIVGDIGYGFEKRSIHEQSKLWSVAQPMYFQTTAEKFNQGATSIATMMRIKLNKINKDGKVIGEVSMFEALGDEATLGDEYRHSSYPGMKENDLLAQLTVSKIRPAVMKTAGDYLSPLLIEQGEIGKLALMFRKWMPEMIADRLHGKKIDYALEKETYGRLNALGQALHSMRSATTWQELKGNEAKYNAALAGATEVAIGTLMTGMMMALGTLYCDTPQCKEKRWGSLVALNLFGRLTDDVTNLMFPPKAIWQAANSPFAAMGTLEDVYYSVDDFASWVLPYGEHGLYEKSGLGYEAGDIKFVNRMKKATPILRVGYNFNRMANEVRLGKTTTALQKAFN